MFIFYHAVYKRLITDFIHLEFFTMLSERTKLAFSVLHNFNLLQQWWNTAVDVSALHVRLRVCHKPCWWCISLGIILICYADLLSVLLRQPSPTAVAAGVERWVVKDASFFSPGFKLLRAGWDRTNDSRVNDVDTPTSTSQRTVMRGSK